jgi:hypothetical protein
MREILVCKALTANPSQLSSFVGVLIDFLRVSVPLPFVTRGEYFYCLSDCFRGDSPLPMLIALSKWSVVPSLYH